MELAPTQPTQSTPVSPEVLDEGVESTPRSPEEGDKLAAGPPLIQVGLVDLLS